MNELEIHPLAESELRAAAQFYEARLPGVGEAFLIEVGRCFDRVRHYPESGTPCYDRFRRLPVCRFPYCVIYEVFPQSVLVVAVAHQRRKPGYWRRRY
jgi:plasmid stabilization system protein ParE